MKSTIVAHLRPEFEPVAVVWSDTIPENARQFKKGRFGCILYLFAEASLRGRVAGGNRETITCNGGRAALGLGVDFDASDETFDRYAAVFSKGLKCTRNPGAYKAQIDTAPKNWKSLLEFGERRHRTADLAREWILHGLPRYDISYEYVLFKPLRQTDSGEDIRAVIFPVNPVELSALVTLAGSVTQGTDSVRVPQGACCTSIGAFVYAEAELKDPRAVMGMLGAEGRKVMRRRFRDDILALTLPAPLFLKMEQEANDCIFQIPSWKQFMKPARDDPT
jgi:uncharacterized protein (DUF169 family)